MSRTLFPLCVLFALLLLVAWPHRASAADDAPMYFDEAVIKERLDRLQHKCFEPRYTRVVESYLRTYFLLKPEKASNILGRSVLYFPMVERKLREQGMPEALKYLPVVESALDPTAVSRSGAVGLWQFMPSTGREYGMRINELVDERRDPERATDAALQYLQRAYKRYKSWPLALAAYNGGGGRVARAIKRSRSRNFWTLRRYLPRETRNYVPAFIAASYLMEYYQLHGVVPDYPSLDHQITETIYIDQPMGFYTLAQVSGISIDILEALNPSYLQRTLVPNNHGYKVVLPSRVVPAVKDYLRLHKQDAVGPLTTPVYYSHDESKIAAKYQQQTYIVQSGEYLYQVAQKLSLTPHQLIAWNRLTHTALHTDQQLVYYDTRPKEKFSPFEPVEVIDPLDAKSMNELTVVAPPKPKVAASAVQQVNGWDHTFQDGEKIFYLVKEETTLYNIARDLPGVQLDQLKSFNQGIRPRRKLNVGTLLVVAMFEPEAPKR